MLTKRIDDKGRITLDKELAGGVMFVEVRPDGSILLRPAATVPADEAWLWNNRKAMASVQRGLKQARSRQFVKGPDLAAATKLAARMEKQ